VGNLDNGSLNVGDESTLNVDTDLRSSTTSNHTCTHLLNFALKSVIGDEVEQKGSLVKFFITKKKKKFLKTNFKIRLIHSNYVLIFHLIKDLVMNNWIMYKEFVMKE
jgi:alanyl-tRNA synthetase